MRAETRSDVDLPRLPSCTGWSEIGEARHFVQFYEDDAVLVGAIGHVIGAALEEGRAAAIIATDAHRSAVEAGLERRGVDVAQARVDGRYVGVDAVALLSSFTLDGAPDREGFIRAVGAMIAPLAARYGRVQVFGELVALLWAAGRTEAAVQVERWWNELAEVHPFSLHCAYPMNGFANHVHGQGFQDVCSTHSLVLPAECPTALHTPDRLSHTLAELQQQMAALANEVAQHEETARALKRREKELADADRRKDEFLAILAHELRNPLSPILTALELLQLSAEDSPTLRSARDVIGRQVRHLARIVDDVLDVSRITSGKIRLRTEALELCTILTHSLEATRPLMDTSRHRLRIVLPPGPVLLNGDGTRLEQVFINLLDNAAKYTEDGGEISIVAEVQRGAASVSVQDTGVGIGPELLPRVFDLFAQADHSLERTRGGLGIGLWMARRIVELHGGTIEGSSDGPGRGSTFAVTLPLDAVTGTHVQPETRTTVLPGSARPLHILVVDDNRDAAGVLASWLQLSGHDVQVAYEGTSALQMTAARRPDVVLLDIGLPGIDGYAIAARLRESGPPRPWLIAVTGYGSVEDRRRAQEAGFDHHVVKPIEPRQFTQLLARLSTGVS